MNPESTPKTIHRGVLQLCDKIRPGVKPIFVPIEPHPRALQNDCFPNVGLKIADQGGQILHGWRILELPGFFIEAEFHAVWAAPDGSLLDVSPKRPGQTHILFLPDPEKTFDEKSLTRRDNIRMALMNHPAVHAFLAHAEGIFQYEEKHTLPNNPRQFAADKEEYLRLEQRKRQLEMEMTALQPGRNDPCPCGSGLKFKKCCAK